MSRWGAVWLIAVREVRERTKSRIFRLGTFMTVLIVIAAIVLPALASKDAKTPTYSIGLVQPAPAQLEASITDLGPSLGALINPVEFRSLGEAEEALRSDQVLLVVVPDQELVTRVAVDPSVNNTVTRIAAAVEDVTRLYAGLQAQGLVGEAASSALNHSPLPLRGLEPAPLRNSDDASASGGGMILLFVFLTLYGAFILNGVIEEKTSRVVEILLSTVRPNELLMGKVLGIGIVGSIQGGALVVATFIARSSTPGASDNALTLTVIGYTLMWFVLGFGIYAWLYACAGALVSRSEDAQNLVFPLQIPLVASYGVGLFSSFNGPNPVLNVMSFIPFTAPMTMLERMAAQQVHWWEVLISVGLCVLTAYLVMRLAVTIFAGGILRSGQRVKLRDAFKAI